MRRSHVHDSRSAFLRACAHELRKESPLPFQELARRVLASSELTTRGRTPKNTLFSLPWRAHHGGYTIDGSSLRLFKEGRHLWIAIEED